MDTTTQILSILTITLTLALILVAAVTVRQTKRRRRPLPALRPIAAYRAIPDYVGRSIETSQPLHLGLGSSGIGNETTLLTLASAELFYQVAQRAAISEVSPIVTLTDPSAVPVAQDTLRRAYRLRNRIRDFRATNARWYPAGSRSLAYAAALTALMGTDRISANVLTGSFGAEIALIAGAGVRRGAPVIAASDQLEGQAIGYAFSEYPLIGEEIFSAGAYLGEDTGHVAQLITLDSLRWVLILALIALLVLRLTNTGG